MKVRVARFFKVKNYTCHHSYFQKASDTYSTWWEDGGHHDSREELNEMITVISFYRN